MNLTENNSHAWQLWIWMFKYISWSVYRTRVLAGTRLRWCFFSATLSFSAHSWQCWLTAIMVSFRVNIPHVCPQLLSQEEKSVLFPSRLTAWVFRLTVECLMHVNTLSMHSKKKFRKPVATTQINAKLHVNNCNS